MNSITIEPIYGATWLALLIAVLTFAVILLVTPPTENRRHRRWLVGLRMTAASVLLLAMIRPAIVRTENRPADAALVVAVDTSRSMTLPDGSGNDRWTAQTATWRRLADGIIGIDSHLNVRLIGFDSIATDLPLAIETLETIEPDGELTDLGAAGLAAIEAAGGQPIAGIVIMGDGTQTATPSGNGIVRVAETLDSLGVPLWTVPIGPSGGQSTARDVAIDTLEESYELFAGNQVDIAFQVRARGLVGARMPVQLSWIDEQGRVTPAASRTVVTSNANETIPLTVPLTVPDPGTYRLQVQAEPQTGELITTNNMQTAFVDVREGGGRILYLEGALRYEQTLLRRSLRRFDDLDLTFRPILASTQKNWPIDLQDHFRPGKYDVYIIGDLDAEAIGNEQLKQLTTAISSGAGLVMLGGYATYGAGGYANSPLAEAIPVRMDSARRQNRNRDKGDRADQIPGPLQIALARQHGITDLGGEDPAGIWQRLPELLGANRLIGPKVAPGVHVLLETPNREPLLVIGEYGRGRTAALAIDSTWRWWRGGQSEAHRRFWRQLVLWLLSREESGEQIVIEMDARRFPVNQPPEFRGRVPLIGPAEAEMKLMAELVDPTGKATPLPTSTGSDGVTIQGRLPTTTPGFYRLRVRPESNDSRLAAQEKAFQSLDESRELAQPMADPTFLKQLAGITADHGGAAYTTDEVEQLIDTIRDRRQSAETSVVKKSRLGDGPLSGWTVFGLFTAALTTEWLLRRRWGLV